MNNTPRCIDIVNKMHEYFSTHPNKLENWPVTEAVWNEVAAELGAVPHRFQVLKILGIRLKVNS